LEPGQGTAAGAGASETMSKAVNNMSMGVVEPQERMKHLSHCGNLIEVDKNMPVTRWVDLRFHGQSAPIAHIIAGHQLVGVVH